MATTAPIHPGEVLLEEFLQPLAVTQYRLAVSIGVPPRRINEIVHGKRRITPDVALRLEGCFGTTDRFWLTLQTRFHLELEKDRLGDNLRQAAHFISLTGQADRASERSFQPSGEAGLAAVTSPN